MAENRAKELRIQQIKLAFANNMRAMREKRGWTQPQLADLVGLHRVTIVRLEMNRRHPRAHPYPVHWPGRSDSAHEREKRLQ